MLDMPDETIHNELCAVRAANLSLIQGENNSFLGTVTLHASSLETIDFSVTNNLGKKECRKSSTSVQAMCITGGRLSCNRIN